MTGRFLLRDGNISNTPDVGMKIYHTAVVRTRFIGSNKDIREDTLLNCLPTLRLKSFGVSRDESIRWSHLINVVRVGLHAYYCVERRHLSVTQHIKPQNDLPNNTIHSVDLRLNHDPSVLIGI